MPGRKKSTRKWQKDKSLRKLIVYLTSLPKEVREQVYDSAPCERPEDEFWSQVPNECLLCEHKVFGSHGHLNESNYFNECSEECKYYPEHLADWSMPA